MFRINLFLFYFFASVVWAETSFRLDIYGSVVNQTWNENSPFNQNNDVLQVPTWTSTLELRPDLQFSFTDNHSVVLRSRHYGQSFETNYLQPAETKTRTEGESDLSDFFFSSTWSDGVSTTIGLQNYQWGPAEIFSPSNPFFHFNNNQKGFFYKEKGRVLTRVNWNPDPETAKWSVIGLYEPVDNNTTFWTADREFTQKAAVKIEYQFTNPANSIAVVAGQGDVQKAFVGEYFNWSPDEGFSLYADVKHTAGRTNYIPQINALSTYDMVEPNNDKVYTFAVIGFRWEGRVDFRQEFVLNEAGFNEEEWDLARESATTVAPNVVRNSKRFAAPGLEFRTQYYSYTSIRIPDLGMSHMASISARWISSMVHDSSALQLNFEYNWNDNLVLSAEAIQYLGSASGEFRIIDDKQASLGFRYSY